MFLPSRSCFWHCHIAILVRFEALGPSHVSKVVWCKEEHVFLDEIFYSMSLSNGSEISGDNRTATKLR